MRKTIQRASEEGGPLACSADDPGRDFQQLWFALARRHWRSAVLVPADEGESSAEAATSLANVGKQLHDFPVTLFIMAKPSDYWPAVQMVNTAASTDDGNAPSPGASSLDYASAVQVVASAASAASSRAIVPRLPAGKVIVSIQPVVAEPIGLAVTLAADVVILCIEKDRTRLSAARRTIELVGRERIAGCLLVNPI